MEKLQVHEENRLEIYKELINKILSSEISCFENSIDEFEDKKMVNLKFKKNKLNNFI